MADLTPETIADLATPRDLDLSPDGRLVAYTLAPNGRREEHPTSALWVAPTDGASPPRQFTAGTAEDRLPGWAPDGAELAFLSDRAKRGTAHLYVLAAGGGEALPLTDAARERPVLDFAWSPAGGHVAFTSADEPDEEDRRRERERDDARVYGERHAFARLRVLDRATREVQTLVAGERHVAAFAWSPDGTQLAYAAQRAPDQEAREEGVAIERVSAGGGPAHPVCTFPVGVNELIWAADGQALLFTGPVARGPQSSQAVYAVPAEGGEPRRLALGEDSCAGGLRRVPGAPSPVVLVAQGMGTQFGWIDLATGTVRPLHPPAREAAQSEIGAWSVRCVAGRGVRRGSGAPVGPDPPGDRSGVVLAVARSADEQPWEVWAGTLPAARGRRDRPMPVLRRLTSHQAALTGLVFGRQEAFAWTAPDGWELDGLLVRPPAEEAPAAGARRGRNAAGRPLPTVVLVHGGPYGRWAPGCHLGPLDWAQWLALAGYAVLLPNPRGGSGHGERFAAAARGDVGGADYRDVLAAVDAAVARGIADPDRLAIGGWSQGGFMAAWAVTQTRRFKAAIMGAGVSDWGMMASTSDLPRFERALGGGAPWDGAGPHRHARLSPISFARDVTTPVLLLHGERDERVPVSQAVGFHRALREGGVPTELVLYPREPHGIRERAHQIDVLRRVRSWCARWLRP